jgi:hypothetical protein
MKAGLEEAKVAGLDLACAEALRAAGDLQGNVNCGCFNAQIFCLVGVQNWEDDLSHNIVSSSGMGLPSAG